MKKGWPWLKVTLLECAGAAERKSGRRQISASPSSTACAPGAAPKRPSARWPPPSSAPPITCSKNELPYQDLGGDYFIRRNKTAYTLRLLRSLNNLGYAVRLTPIAA